jgi:hypothetical protein
LYDGTGRGLPVDKRSDDAANGVGLIVVAVLPAADSWTIRVLCNRSR